MAGKSRWSDDDVSEEEYGHQDHSDEEDIALLLDLKKLSLDNHKDNEPAVQKKKKFLLIFNLSGLLVHCVHNKKRFDIPKNRRPDARVTNKLVYRRPYCEEFMRFCLEKFEVGIWSSAMGHNVDDVLEAAFGKLIRFKLLFVWNQEQCSDYGIKCEENQRKPLFFKELNKVWESKHKQLDGGSFTSSNTLLIDDSPSKGLLNPPNTGIYPYTYDPEDHNDNALDPKGELGSYLKELAEAEDVPSYVALHPFGQPPIKPGHPRWSFYSRVRSSVNTKKDRIGKA